MVARRRRVGADQRETHLGPVPIGDPCLLPVDDPAAVLASNATATDGCDVAARVRLAEQLAPDVLAAPHRRQQRGLLFLRAEVKQYVCRQIDLVDWPRSARTQDLLADDAVVQRVVIGAAAVLDGPVSADEPRVEQRGEPRAQDGFLLGVLRSAASFPCLERRCVFGDVRPYAAPEFGQLRVAGPHAFGAHQPAFSATSARLPRAVPSR